MVSYLLINTGTITPDSGYGSGCISSAKHFDSVNGNSIAYAYTSVAIPA